MSRRLIATAALVALAASGAVTFGAHADDTPEVWPTPATCLDFADDGTNDGSAGSHLGVAAGAPSDDDLDIKGLALRSTDTTLEFYISVKKLGTRPTAGLGHAWEVTFTALGKNVRLDEIRYENGSLNSTWGSKKVFVDNKVNTTVPLSVWEDTGKSFVVFTVDRAKLGAAVGGALSDGTVLATLGLTSGTASTDSSVAADQMGVPAATPYKIGSEKCFPPPPTVTEAGPAVTVQYGDTATVSATLTMDEAPIEGADLTFSIAGTSVTRTTNEDGVATATIVPPVSAGRYTVTASFTGDESAASSSAAIPLTVTQEVTRTTIKSAAAGTKRTVTATVVDDDAHPVAGQVVTWYVNGKKVTTSKTSSAGTATFSASAGQTVVAQFNAVAGKYLASKATKKV